MRYINSGIEIQYRECQIARDAAKKLKEAKGGQHQLKENRQAWIASVRSVADSLVLKQEDCITIVNFLTNMPQEQYEAFSEYVEFLVKRGKGIDILVPYISRNGMLLLTVNRHAEQEFGEY